MLDTNGGAVGGATVTLMDQATGSTTSVVTNTDGRYIIQNVRLGTYTVTATKTGFQTANAVNQPVSVGETTTVNFKLPPGSVSQTVEVTSTPGAELQTMNATMGTAMTATQISALPNFSEDANDLVQYQPTNSGNGYIAGAMFDQNTFELDGGNNTDDLDSTNTAYNTNLTFARSSNGGGGTVPTPVESIQEVRVATSNQTADFTGSSGAEIEMVTKRGTNQFHGAGYEFFTADWLDANTWSANHTPLSGTADKGGLRTSASPGTPLNFTPESKLHNNRYGFSLGGPLIPVKVLGGKTYFFVNFEQYIDNTATNEEEPVATPALRSGIISEQNSAGTWETWNVGAAPGLSGSNCGASGTALCDPLNQGVSPAVAAYMKTYEPLPTDPTCGQLAATSCDQHNTQGYQGLLVSPLRDTTFVTRVDHDFSSNWRAYMSYRWFDEYDPSTPSGGIDFGGIAPGDTFGTFTGLGDRPLQPAYFVTSISGQLTPNVTNDFHFNFVRNFWQWGTKGVPQPLNGVDGFTIPAGITIGDYGNQGASGLGALDAMDIGWGDARQRSWDGHDWNYRDDVSWLHGNHLLQFGGTFAHQWLHHVRDDDGNSTLEQLRYVVGPGNTFTGIAATNPEAPPVCTTAQASATSANCVASGNLNAFNDLYYDMLGVVGQANELVTRTGTNLQAEPPNTPAFETADLEIPDFYFSDAWHVRPAFTLTLGLNYGISYAPREITGDKQMQVVDSSGVIVTAQQYFSTKERDALQGINYDPVLGYEPVGALGPNTREFPAWYGGIAPRTAFSWNPTINGGGWLERIFGHNSSVLRGGWSRDIDREGNTQTVLSGLLGIGFLQSEVCNAPQAVGPTVTCVGTTGGPALGTTTAANAFRLGNTSLGYNGNVVPLPPVPPTLALPVMPGTCSVCNAPTSSNGINTDYDYHPGIANEFTLSWQRQLPGQTILELGYVRRRGREVFDTVGLSAGPYMFTYGGQSFENAYANIENYMIAHPGLSAATYASQIPAQPFFEAALGGPGSTYCSAGHGTCTAEVITKEATNLTNVNVAGIFSDLDKSWVFGPTLLTSQGLGTTSGIYDSGDFGINNYDAGTITLNKRANYGVTYNANLTWARSFYDAQDNSTNGNGVYTANPYDQSYSYTPGPGYNLAGNFTASWNLPWDRSQKGIVGRAVGGWTVAPILTWHSGSPICASDGSSAFGVTGNTDCAILTNSAPVANVGAHYYYAPTSVGSGNNLTSPINWFPDPAAVVSALRPVVVGMDGRAWTPLGYGPQFWDLDMAASKDIAVHENIGMTLSAQALNVFNHTNYSNPGLNYQNTLTFGDLTETGNRTIEVGVRVHF